MSLVLLDCVICVNMDQCDRTSMNSSSPHTFALCLYFQALMYTPLIGSEIFTMVGSGNNVKLCHAWLLWNIVMTQLQRTFPDELAKWQHSLVGISEWKIVTQCGLVKMKINYIFVLHFFFGMTKDKISRGMSLMSSNYTTHRHRSCWRYYNCNLRLLFTEINSTSLKLMSN